MMMLLAGLSILLIVSVIFSLVRNDYWVFRILEYPRLQKLFLMLGVFGLWLIYWPAQHTFYQILVACLALCIIYLLYKILPYTILFKKEMKHITSRDPRNEIRIFAANVF